ncbi:hypothetical protein N5923_14745 [Erwiniaceae bacterium BAC15a-03b]|uniref:Uncharacterized protein n=1 Tax=Winslowiella arboricola TaxID=2978220 RepID=A0A9J6PQX0_9GAMM|nr:hypothetical protein [Winslowiella arboricola]MCU5773164.1 hypothetical protein [Winslowiella arboricola]MCU5778747.1 hypothetical protein [Winslowiella arboricola]
MPELADAVPLPAMTLLVHEVKSIIKTADVMQFISTSLIDQLQVKGSCFIVLMIKIGQQ